MKRKYIKRIKKLNLYQDIYKIYNVKEDRFTDGGVNHKLSAKGRTYYEKSNAKRAFNLIPDDEKKDYKIIKLLLKTIDVQEDLD